MHPKVDPSEQSPRSDERGSVMAEYLVLLTLVSIGAVASTLALGPPLVRWYQLQRVYVLVGVP